MSTPRSISPVSGLLFMTAIHSEQQGHYDLRDRGSFALTLYAGGPACLHGASLNVSSQTNWGTGAVYQPELHVLPIILEKTVPSVPDLLE